MILQQLTIEVYASGQEIPALYDAYIDKQGTVYPMCPVPRHELDDIMQVVLERDIMTPNDEQVAALNFLIRVNTARCHLFFHWPRIHASEAF